MDCNHIKLLRDHPLIYWFMYLDIENSIITIHKNVVGNYYYKIEASITFLMGFNKECNTFYIFINYNPYNQIKDVNNVDLISYRINLITKDSKDHKCSNGMILNHDFKYAADLLNYHHGTINF